MEAGLIDVLVANLAIRAPTTAAVEVSEAEWRAVFAALVDPLPHLVGAAAPGMIQRRAGKILVMGSASALRGMKRASTYSAARGAQLAYLQAVGVELAPHKVQVNAIAQNFVDNPTYFPPEVQANPRFQERLKREVPLGRLVARVKTPSSPPTCAARRPTALWGRCFRCAEGGWGGEGGGGPSRLGSALLLAWTQLDGPIRSVDGRWKHFGANISIRIAISQRGMVVYSY
ncbi:SDR family oxidoreductase [Candidatus Skiveiella danica]|uniref:SDR family oxidoreductase n=1 Tax=Candidatus Skiveiella danica TaxID=3386177 RepID=UPI0039B85481